MDQQFPPPCGVKKIPGGGDWNISSITTPEKRRSKLRGIGREKKKKKKNPLARSIDGHYLDDGNKLARCAAAALNGRTRRRERKECPIESTWLVTVIT